MGKRIDVWFEDGRHEHTVLLNDNAADYLFAVTAEEIKLGDPVAIMFRTSPRVTVVCAALSMQEHVQVIMDGYISQIHAEI